MHSKYYPDDFKRCRVGEDECRRKKQQDSHAVGAVLREQKAQNERYGKEHKREAELVGIHQLALTAADKYQIQDQKSNRSDDRITVVPVAVRHDEHCTDKGTEQEFKVENKRAAAQPHYKAAFPCRSGKARNCGEQSANYVEDKAQYA